MPGQKRKTRRAKKHKAKSCKRRARRKNSAIVAVKIAALPMAQPRPRTRLRTALRATGLDEWKIAWILNEKVDELEESKTSSDNKALLDYMKEAIRHLDPAAAAAASASQEPVMSEMAHKVGRPDRTNPNG